MAQDNTRREWEAHCVTFTGVRLNGSTYIVWERISFVIDDKTSAKLAAIR